MSKIKVFRSDEGRDKIRGYYNMILSFVPYAKKFTDTSFGRTFYIDAGDPQKQALILIHGSCSNSAAWLGDIPALSEHYHVISVDIPGEPGNSEENRLDFTSDEYPRWLCSFLDSLGIKKAAVMGNSLGGWLALQFAAAYPEKISALILLAPSGIVPHRQSFLDLTASENKVRDNAAPVRDSIFGNTDVPREVLEFLNLIAENFVPVTGTLPVLSDNQMGRLTMPVLLIAGKNDVTADMEAASARLNRFAPQTETVLTEGSHVIMSSAGIVLPFLLKHPL